MVTEKNHATGHVSPRRSWWEQAESVVGYLNAFELTGDEAYFEKSLRSWEYIKKNFIDRKNGGWREDPDCAESVPNDQGSLNSVVTV